MEPLILLGMHRSGTSVTGNWLQECGVFLGSTLIKGGTGNSAGHFENECMVQFHESLLKKNQMTYLSADSDQISLPENFHQEALELAACSKRSTCWGWKDPRTALFMKSVWHSIFPGAKVMVIFRDPEEVALSILRRQIKTYNKPLREFPVFKDKLYVLRERLRLKSSFYQKNLMDESIAAYSRYNRSILEYLEMRDETDFLVLTINNLRLYDEKIIHWMNDHWQSNLTYVDFNSLFRKSALHVTTTTMDNHREYPAEFRKLQALNERTIKKINATA